MSLNKKEKENGIVFTPLEMGYFMAENALKHIKINPKNDVVVLEPSAGDGALAYAMVKTLFSSGYKKIHLIACDLEEHYLIKLKERINKDFPTITLDLVAQDFLDLSLKETLPKVDIVISNPPYVRTQNMDKKYIDFASQNLNLIGRFDLYHLFICMLKKVLKPDGVLSIIVSNKFLSNKSGLGLRTFIDDNYAIESIFDFGDSRVFAAAVLPVVLILKNTSRIATSNNSLFCSCYSSPKEAVNTSESVYSLFNKTQNGIIRINNAIYKVLCGVLSRTKSAWALKTNEDEAFLSSVLKQTTSVFKDYGKIKVGIKTTCDKVFISNKWHEIKDTPELLMPLITHRIANKYFSKEETSYQVLYPYQFEKGKKTLVNLELYPNAKKYLLSNYEILSSRKYIQESSKEWFEIWVPHSPEKWKKPKIVFRDICETPQFWFVDTNEVVNGDCYWFDFYENTSIDDIYLILAISNSEFIEKYYDLRFNNKLYSGRRRFMSQYVEQFPVFDKNKEEAKKIIALLKKANKNKEISEETIKELNNLVWAGFNQKNR